MTTTQPRYSKEEFACRGEEIEYLGLPWRFQDIATLGDGSEVDRGHYER